MELSIIRLQEPAPDPVGERRRCVRHKLHTRAYASCKGSNAGMMLDLSELLDLSEDGFAVQTSERLEANRPVSFSLDLRETKTQVQSTGHVVWSDGAGRAGIRFSGLPEGSRRQLKEWLFVNLLIASTNYAARTAPVSPRAEKEPSARQLVVQSAVPASVADLSGMLSAVEAVRREVRAAGDDFDAILHLITERALSLTGASGAALALLTDSKITCRASAGEPALMLGTEVNSKHGLTGECVRSGQMVSCEDTESDPRVDREVCRNLGIGSILAAPILSDSQVVGLLEVFSPQSRAFAEIHKTALDRLVEIVPATKTAAVPPRDATANVVTPLASEVAPAVNEIRESAWEPGAQEVLKGVPVRLGHLIALFMIVGIPLALTSLYAGFRLAPSILRLWQSKSAQASGPAATGAATAASNSIHRPEIIENLRKRAEAGDSDAQWDMGYRYRNGEGVLQDDVQASQWFLRAAEQGHVTAQGTIAASYWAGRGVPKDLSRAYFWSVLAANQGDETSSSRMQGLALQMTRAQVAAAQQQADSWLAQHHATK